MELGDALTITVLGMSVVFSGLLLTALLIVALGGLDAIPARSRSGRSMPESPPQNPTAGEPLNPEIVTVIATVLEIERRLHHAEAGRKLTFARSSTRDREAQENPR